MDEYLRLVEETDALSKGSSVQPSAEPAKKDQPSGLSNSERRELKKRYDAVSRRLEKLEDEPDRLRTAMSSIDPSNYADLMASQAKVDECLAEKAALEEEWLELAERLEL